MENYKNYYSLYIKYKTKYIKYKIKYISSTNITFENEYLTNNLNPTSNFYYKQNLFNYWISS